MKPPQIPLHGLSDYARIGEEIEGIYVGRFRETLDRLPNRLHRHRHDYYEAFHLDGMGAHFNDFAIFPITGPTLVFVSPGQIHRWNNAGALQGWIVCFTQELFDRGVPPPSPLLNHSFWRPDNPSPVLGLPAGAVKETQAIFAEMHREYVNKSAGYEDVLAAMLRILFIRADRIYQHVDASPAALPPSSGSFVSP